MHLNFNLQITQTIINEEHFDLRVVITKADYLRSVVLAILSEQRHTQLVQLRLHNWLQSRANKHLLDVELQILQELSTDRVDLLYVKVTVAVHLGDYTRESVIGDVCQRVRDDHVDYILSGGFIVDVDHEPVSWRQAWAA